jgi:hypothetical protein
MDEMFAKLEVLEGGRIMARTMVVQPRRRLLQPAVCETSSLRKIVTQKRVKRLALGVVGGEVECDGSNKCGGRKGA